MLIGNFNAKINSEIPQEFTGKHGRGERSKRRERSIDFCQEETAPTPGLHYQSGDYTHGGFQRIKKIKL